MKLFLKKCFFSTLLFCSMGAFAQQEDLRQEVRNLLTEIDELSETKLKGVFTNTNGQIIRAFVGARVDGDNASISVSAPIYEVSFDILRDRGSNVLAQLQLDEDSYDFRKEENGSSVTYLLKNRVWSNLEQEPRVRRQGVTVTRNDEGGITKIGVGTSLDGRQRPVLKIVEIKDWLAPVVILPENVE